MFLVDLYFPPLGWDILLLWRILIHKCGHIGPFVNLAPQ